MKIGDEVRVIGPRTERAGVIIDETEEALVVEWVDGRRGRYWRTSGLSVEWADGNRTRVSPAVIPADRLITLAGPRRRHAVVYLLKRRGAVRICGRIRATSVSFLLDVHNHNSNTALGPQELPDGELTALVYLEGRDEPYKIDPDCDLTSGDPAALLKALQS